MIEIVKHSLRGLLAAFLPSPERERYARQREVHAPRWSLAVGVVQLVAGALLFMLLGLDFTQHGVGAVQIDQPGLTIQNWQGVGMIHWLGWFFHPASWPWSYMTAVGLVRCITYGATREAVGEPLVLAGMRIVQHRRARKAELEFRERLGPFRRDRVIPAGERELVILSSREKPEWADTVTVTYDGRYYKCVEVDLQPDDAWQVLAYRLREEPPGAVIRRLVRYDGPGDA